MLYRVTFTLTNFGINDVCDFLHVNKSNLPLSCTVSGPISARIHWVWTPTFKMGKYGHNKLETSLYHMVQTVFLYLVPLRCDSRVWWTNRLADRSRASLCCRPRITPYPLYRCYQVIVQYWSNFHFQVGVPLFIIYIQNSAGLHFCCIAH